MLARSEEMDLPAALFSVEFFRANILDLKNKQGDLLRPIRFRLEYSYNSLGF